MPKVIDLPTASSMDDSDYLLMEESSGGTKKITRGNVLSNIGSNYQYVETTLTQLPTGSGGVHTNVASITLTPGVWIVQGNVRHGGSYNGLGAMGLSRTSQASDLTLAYVQYAVSTATTNPSHTVCIVRSITQAETLYLVAFQNSGSTKDLSVGNIRAIRIA